MKKIFTLAAAVLFATSIFAATETVPKANNTWTGTSVSITNDECANSEKAITKDGESDKVTFVKFRTNKNGNTITLNVNSGIKVTGISLRAYSNNATAKVALTGVSYDGVAEDPFAKIEFPGNDANTTATYEKAALEATQSIVFSFDNSEVDPDDSNNKNNQIMAVLTITYDITATTYKATYKSNMAEVADVVDAVALVVKGNPFKEPADKYFIGWNNKEDGTGDAIAVGTALSADTTLFAQWKAFEAALTLNVAASGDDAAKGGEVALEEGSNGGKLIFAGAKDDIYTESFVYKDAGLQLSKGGADSLRAELAYLLKAGSVLRITLVAANEGSPSLNIIPLGKSAIEMTANFAAAKNDTAYVYYEVIAGDGLDGASQFIIQRGGSSVILAELAIANHGDAVDAGGETPEPAKSTDATISDVKINDVAVTENEGVFAYEVAADADLAKVVVTYKLADKATVDDADKSGFEIEVPAAGAAAATKTITVTAEDGTTTKEYTFSVTKAKAAEGGEGGEGGQGEGGEGGEEGGDDQAVDNIDAAAPATKVLRNGMLLIEKNGVLYNAQGVVVR